MSMNGSLPVNGIGRGTSAPVPLKRTGSLEVEKKRLFKAAKEMESLFLGQILKAMRRSIPKTDKDNKIGPGGGIGKDIYTQMFDQELATLMAGKSDKSLASVIYRSMEKVLERQFDGATEEPVGNKEIFPAGRYINIRQENATGSAGAMELERLGEESKISEYDSIIRQVSEKYRLNPALVRSVIEAESNGDPTAISRAGAKGLMQLTDTTAAELGVKDVFNPRQNIEGGARYLRFLIDRFGDIRKALAAYNAGPETVKRYGGMPPFPETRRYVQNVLGSVDGKQLFY